MEPSILRCPECGDRLQAVDVALQCDSGHRFEPIDGFPDLVYPRRLAGSDAEFLGKYDAGAAQYDRGLEWLFESFYEDENEVRSAIAGMLELAPNARVLEIGSGTGKDSMQIANRLNASGHLWVTEISSRMLGYARSRLSASETLPKIDFILVNGSCLPFEDGTFDAVFHFGGINEFSERAGAIEEMTRVTKRNGKVVFGDEGLAPWLRKTERGRMIANANALYHHEPPLQDLPVSARAVTLRWILGNAFWILSYNVGDGAPPVNIDLPIPGKGDSLRLRYEKVNPNLS